MDCKGLVRSGIGEIAVTVPSEKEIGQHSKEWGNQDENYPQDFLGGCPIARYDLKNRKDIEEQEHGARQ
jgi:hypothetical protein